MNIKNYKIISEVRKTMSVFVYPNKDVLIKVPLNANQEKIDDFIKRKSDWIQKQLNFFSRPKVVAVDSLSNGSELFLLGKQYQLIIKKNSKDCFFIKKDKNNILLSAPKNTSNGALVKYLKKWLKEKALHVFNLSLKRNITKFPQIKVVPEIKIRKLSKRWGSFNKGNILLSPNLIFVPRTCIDYIVIHELCHLFIKQHNSKFYSLLGSKIPKWRDIKKQLEENKFTL